MVEFFESAHVALDDYDIALDKAGRREELANLLDEAHSRLSQLEYLLNAVMTRVLERFQLSERPIKMQRLLTDFAKATGQEPPAPIHYKLAWTDEELARRNDLAFEAELFTETFYWTAWRLRNVLRLLPELKNFDVVTTRNARNHLVEHPEQNLRVTPTRNLRFSRTEGVTLMRGPPANGSGDEGVDAGLASNAADFRDRMASALIRALALVVS
jgi:hypothetical protein